MERVSARIPTDELHRARQSFAADAIDLEGSPRTWGEWVSEALLSWAAHSPTGRADIRDELDDIPPDPHASPISIPVPAATRAAIDAAVEDDQRAGIIISRATFLAEALQIAADATTLRRHGDLPTIPPAGLPRRGIQAQP